MRLNTWSFTRANNSRVVQMEYSTLAARLATFDPPTKRSKAGWPHKQPSAETVANAGFYYRPQSTGSDNVVCYLCERQLDGWEEEDDPVEEHLKHSPECGWAMLMAVAQKTRSDGDEMEDPTGASMADARRATFAIGWPHESKRGWVCKTEKMVEAGWYFAPTQECEDWVSCAYCKLSLDGWEPKDNPFDEHYRRAPDCVFFQFAGTTAPSRRPKAKKGRASKASRTSKASTRLSTQSSASVQSEGLSMTDIPDLDESIDTSTLSILSTMSTASTTTSKAKRRAGGSRTKSTKSKKAKTTRSTRNKKADADPQPATEPQQRVESEGLQPATDIVRTSQLELMPANAEPNREDDAEQRLPSPMPVAEPVVTDPSLPQPTLEPAKHLPPSPSPRPSQPRTKRQAPTHRSSPVPRSPSAHSTSDIENAPPSTRSPASRPPLSSSSATNPDEPLWTPVDLEMVFRLSPVASRLTPADALAAESLFMIDDDLDEGEKNMTVQEWIEHVAAKAEADLKMESERVVGVFEREGSRALRVLEGMECSS